MMSMACVTTKDQMNAQVLGHHSLVTMLGTEGHAATGTVIIWVTSTAASDHGVDWTELLRGTMSRSMSPLAARVCVDVRGSCYH